VTVAFVNGEPWDFKTAQGRLLVEIRRILRPGALALLDAGPGGTSPTRLEELLAEAGFDVCGRTRSCWLDRYWQYCCRLRP